MFAIFDVMHDRISFASRIAKGFRGRCQEGVTLAPLPRGLDRWPEGHGWPDQLVGVSLADARVYRVFTYASDLAGSGFRSTRMTFGGAFETFPVPS